MRRTSYLARHVLIVELFYYSNLNSSTNVKSRFLLLLMCARKKVWFLLCKFGKFSAPYQSTGKAFPPQMFCFLHSHCFRVASECRKRAEHARFAVMDSLYVNFAWCVHKKANGKHQESTYLFHYQEKINVFASLSHKLLISQPNSGRIETQNGKRCLVTQCQVSS